MFDKSIYSELSPKLKLKYESWKSTLNKSQHPGVCPWGISVYNRMLVYVQTYMGQISHIKSLLQMNGLTIKICSIPHWTIRQAAATRPFPPSLPATSPQTLW